MSLKGPKTMCADTMFGRLIRFVGECETQQEAARKLNITPQYLSDILKGRRALSPVIAKFFGYRPVTVYRRIDA